MMITGCLLIIFGIWMALFFYEFPAISSLFTVTFWRDTIAFSLVSVAGLSLLVTGIVRLVKNQKVKN